MEAGDDQREPSSPVSKSFENLSTTIRGLKGLSLNITALKCTSPYYRGTKPYPRNHQVASEGNSEKIQKRPRVMLAKPKRGSPPLRPSIKVLLIAERNKNWGDNPTVVREVKAAFYNELALLLNKVRSRWLAFPVESRLVVVQGRTVFSIKLVMQNELDAAANASASVNRRVLTKMCVSQQLLSLAKKNPSFGDSCRLVRRWLGSNFLSATLDGIVVELMVAHAFVSPNISTPITETAGLFAFLRLLSTHDFVSQPVIVDIDRKLSEDKFALLRADFTRKRPTFPMLTLITPEDTRGGIFTHSRPEPVLLKRLVQLASSSAHSPLSLRTTLPGINSALPEDLFQHSLSIYDLVIRLRGKHVVSGCRDQHPKKRSKKRLANEAGGAAQADDAKPVLPVIDYNPPKSFLKELTHHYGSMAIFFHNEYELHAIGVVLRPEWKTKIGVPCLVEDWKMLGRGLVRDIIINEVIREK